MFSRLPLLLLVLVASLLLAACRSGDPGGLVVYTGRSQVLVDGIVQDYRGVDGVRVRVRHGRDAEMLAALQEEGARSPADVFWANTTGALGAAANAGLLVPLPDSLRVRAAAFVPSGGTWVPVTVRFRVLAYAPGRVDAAALPASVLELPAREELRGRIGWTPTYSSFQDFVTALRLLHGEAEARAWVDGVRALEPRAYPGNGAMLEALLAGEIDVALTNHYYVLRAQADAGPGAVAIHHFRPGDVGNLALVTGAGVLASASDPEAAQRFLAYLLTPEVQARFVEQIQEFPVVRGVAGPPGEVSFEEALRLSPNFDLEGLRDLEATLRLLRDAGLL